MEAEEEISWEEQENHVQQLSEPLHFDDDVEMECDDTESDYSNHYEEPEEELSELLPASEHPATSKSTSSLGKRCRIEVEECDEYTSEIEEPESLKKTKHEELVELIQDGFKKMNEKRRKK